MHLLPISQDYPALTKLLVKGATVQQALQRMSSCCQEDTDHQPHSVSEDFNMLLVISSKGSGGACARLPGIQVSNRASHRPESIWVDINSVGKYVSLQYHSNLKNIK